jgi:hypothetical protein
MVKITIRRVYINEGSGRIFRDCVTARKIPSSHYVRHYLVLVRRAEFKFFGKLKFEQSTDTIISWIVVQRHDGVAKIRSSVLMGSGRLLICYPERVDT